jgi:replicative DNA helicase
MPVYNHETEKAVLSSLLVGREESSEIFSILVPDAFFDPRHRMLYAVMHDMYIDNHGIDIITVHDEICDRGLEPQIGGITYLSDLADGLTYKNPIQYAREVEHDYVKRRLATAAESIREHIAKDTDDDILTVKNDCLRMISEIGTTSLASESTGIRDVAERCLEYIIKKHDMSQEDREKKYLGFADLDKITDGVHDGELVIIGARPSVGKTAFALNMALNLAERMNNVLFFSREMSQEVLTSRILSYYSGIEGHVIRRAFKLTPEDFISLRKSAEYISGLNLYIDSKTASVEGIRAVCREMKNKGSLDAVVIDYLGLLQTSKRAGDRRAELEQISRSLKLIAGEFMVPIICLSQLNRSSSKENREPELTDLRETGAIEQDADTVMFLHVPSFVKDENTRFPMKVLLKKQRNGPIGHVWLWNSRDTMRFENMSLEDIEVNESVDHGGGEVCL